MSGFRGRFHHLEVILGVGAEGFELGGFLRVVGKVGLLVASCVLLPFAAVRAVLMKPLIP